MHECWRCCHYLRLPWKVGDDLLRLQAAADIVLLLVEKGEACCNITGHQVCVLGGKAQWPAVKTHQMVQKPLSIQLNRVHTQAHYIEKGIYYFLCV